MAFITWDQKYSVSISGIDDQHKKLIGMINDLHDAMKTGRAKDIMDKLIQSLSDYTSTHFSLEEMMMEQNKYPQLNEHRKEHQYFVNQVRQFQSNFNNGSSMVSIEILNFLRDWLLKHILVTDKLYSPYIKG
jgi:hemerythrin